MPDRPPRLLPPPPRPAPANRRRRWFAAVACAVLFTLPALATAQEAPGDEVGPTSQPAAPRDAGTDGSAATDGAGETSPETVQPPVTVGPQAALPESPRARLTEARAAFRRTDYALLAPLLAPIAGTDSPLETLDERTEARELLGVGLFFLAQQVTTAKEREELMQRARDEFLTLLREAPNHALDALTFPASVVEVFEDVKEANAEELDELRRGKGGPEFTDELKTLYVERASTQYPMWANFFPLGVGQFQNGQAAKGTAFALLQGAAFGLNVASYLMIESLRDPKTGFVPRDDLVRALTWRRTLYVSLGSFIALYALSVADALWNYEPERVRIRTLDAPPPELGAPGGTGAKSGVPLGLGLEFPF